MKRLITLLLVTGLILLLCACNIGGTAETNEAVLQGLQVGYARESIMPDSQGNMSGSGNQEHRISTVTNGYDNYIPSQAAYEYGCYESYTARYAAGTAEKASEEFVQMLKDIQ